MRTVPGRAPYIVACPNGHEKETRAAPGMRLRCAECGTAFRAPDTEDLPTGTRIQAPPAGARVGGAAATGSPDAPAQGGPGPDAPPSAPGPDPSATRARPSVGAPVLDPDPDDDDGAAELVDDDDQPPAVPVGRPTIYTRRVRRRG